MNKTPSTKLSGLWPAINLLIQPKFNVTLKKSLFGKTESEYLGFWVTCDGVKPINRKIEAITNMNPPTSQQ